MGNPYLSVVVPVLNEEDNVAALSGQISAALDATEYTYEKIFVDDGSKDSTVDRLRELQHRDPHVRVVKLRRNFGQTPAMRAGIDHSHGEVVVTLDGDLQNDPADIPGMVRKLEDGYDLVVGWRKDRKDPFLSRKLPSKIANWLIGKITRIPIKDNGCSLKVYKAKVIRNIPLYSEMHRFIPAMSSLAAVRLAEVPVNHKARIHGESKYGISRTGKVILDLITIKMLIAFSQRPIQWFGLLSIPFFLASSLAGLIALYLVAYGDQNDQTVIFPSLCVLFGIIFAQFLANGLLAELIVKTGKTHDFYALTRRRSSGS